MKYWIAIATAENCKVLASMGHPFYALSGRGSSSARSAAPKDRCVLYQAKGGRHGSGFVGEFEIAEGAAETPVRFAGLRKPFDIRLPWIAKVLCEGNPVSIVPLLPNLEFVANKKYYGMSLRSNFQGISKSDYDLIARCISEHATDRDAQEQ